MMITNTEMTNWIIEKFSGSGGIRTHDLRVASPLLYQLRYRALGAAPSHKILKFLVIALA